MAFEARRILQPGPIILLIALILSIMVAISLPFFDAMDIARVHWPTVTIKGVTVQGLDQLRFGIWDACYAEKGSNKFVCPLPGEDHGLGYAVAEFTFIDLNNPGPPDISEGTISAVWTRGLVFHPIVAGLVFVAFVASIADSVFLPVIASITSLFAAFVALIAFIIDIALYVHIKNELGGKKGGDVITGPAFWLSFVVLILTLIASCVVFIHHRRNSGNDIEMSRFFKLGGRN